MNSKRPVIVKRSLQSQALPQRRASFIQEPVVKSFEQLEIEQPEQPEPVINLESVAEPPLDQSIYGSGWSVTELMTEFSGRYDG